MKNIAIKYLLAINVAALILDIIFISKAYLGGVDDFTRAHSKTVKLQNEIKTEKSIEKLRNFSLLSLESEAAATSLVDVLLQALKWFISICAGVVGLNIYYLAGNLCSSRKKA